jgi:tetratricopeptide (TPR) repeat protein
VCEQTQQDPAQLLKDHHDKAQAATKAGDLQGAERECQQVITLGLQQLGNIESGNGNYAEAANLLHAAVDSNPSYADTQIDLAIVYFRQGDSQKAKSLAESVLQKDPQAARARKLLGKIYLVDGDLARSIEELKAGLTIQPDFETAYSLGINYLQAKRLSEASELFDRILAVEGPSAALHVLFGRAYRETGFLELAIREFNKAIAIDPKFPRAHYYVGYAYLIQLEETAYPQARAAFEEELKIQPDDYLSLLYLGIITVNQREFAVAAPLLEHAIRVRPDAPEPLLYVGQLYFNTDRLQLAIATLRKYIELSGRQPQRLHDSARAHYLLGQSLLRLGQTDEAKREVQLSEELRVQNFKLGQARQQAREQQPKQEEPLSGVLSNSDENSRKAALRAMLAEPAPSQALQKAAQEYRAQVGELLAAAYNDTGVIHASQKDYVNAAEYFQKAARWKPDFEGLNRNWGMASFRAKRYADAVSPLSEHLVRHPEDRTVRQLLGLSYFMTDDFAKTTEVLASLASDPPSDPGLLYAWGVALVRTEQSAAAAKMFERMLQQNSNSPEIHLMLGQAYAQEKEYELALKELTRALELQPSLAQAHYYSGLVLLHQGQQEKAADQFRAELKLNPSDTMSKYYLAYVLIGQQQTNLAIRLLEEVIREKPEDVNARFEMGRALLLQGDAKAAIQALEAAARLAPERDKTYAQLSIAYGRDGRREDAQRALDTYRNLREKRRREAHDTSLEAHPE